jgi:hypothetical protein
MGVLSVLVVIGIWYLATHGKGIVAARLVAWLLLPIVALVLIGFNDPGLTGGILANFARGIHQAADGFASFLHML